MSQVAGPGTRRGRILVAGVGNVFLGDDGFGSEVAREVAVLPMPQRVEVRDFGIRGVHLAYELLDGCDLLVLVDAMDRGVPPGTVVVLEPTFDDEEGSAAVDPEVALLSPMDAHDLTPAQVFDLLARLQRAVGGSLCRTLVVACQPGDVSPGMGLTDDVRAAVPRAIDLIADIVEREESP